ncbi:dynein axonemal heavy chain 3-like [Uloborus diversus]|uniref:dynein axonemal heavy chain 3-like n=1 Tax=Uloborus diversus TaxID=327109 RepID=UPI00240A0E95|nr:dynein axonemal heavy chain 3-like [Uloborus diversus]
MYSRFRKKLAAQKEEAHKCLGVKRKLPEIDVFCGINKAAEEYPPLFAPHGQTKFISYKAKEYHHSPSNLIGANYRGGSEIPDTRNFSITLLLQRTMRHKLQSKGKTKQGTEDLVLEPKRKPVSPLQQRKKAFLKLPKLQDVEDAKRYCYYVDSISSEDIPSPKFTLKLLCKRVKVNLNHLSMYPDITAKLFEETKENYFSAIKQGIVDYVLLDPAERKRLNIKRIPPKQPQVQIQPPFPWSNSVKTTGNILKTKIFLPRLCIKKIAYLWAQKYQDLELLPVENFAKSPIPPFIEDFREFVKSTCNKMRSILRDG